ncbi:MAG: 50S ribosomal protein L15 [Elusimicrobia bacterium RIFOXYB2_FULL_48_7]|nr:MAG: 50S ribosomal protein L15 [Elusimicrobia bacterium RIFOXYB2_FULL_48_7]
MKLNNLRPAAGSRHRKKILGHGRASGHGASSTRGMKGQRSRSGGTKAPWFEGGQMPLLRRIPKRGFTNRKFRTEYYYVNLGQLEKLFDAGTEINPDLLIQKKMIDNTNLDLKVLGGGELKKAFKIRAHKFSKSAIEKIKSAGGSAEEIVVSVIKAE